MKLLYAYVCYVGDINLCFAYLLQAYFMLTRFILIQFTVAIHGLEGTDQTQRKTFIYQNYFAKLIASQKHFSLYALRQLILLRFPL